ncbi:MAG: DUF1926 domain-containing protein, partial [Nitrospinaceae bacterium]|nr:DUF1926 domain-containing protein [Nitrospinaceae bacterium]NIR53802.1 DUF1926 domain-containing protein [Nitrospinaceae bacterium]NIS84213.1 DUF1926 domain-containing protein [Nitrospinaceae bacterium]NIT81019.1 DUF1926 domain-containing protein [Nitrospinaceae bacterium]NIU43308.1 DUF1926 domain-containing protein [Nitrospinaceae bacterium]
LEWLKDHRPEYLDTLRSLVAGGQLELMSGGFYEPILSSLPEEDAVGQIRMMNEFIETEFDCRPQGLWLTERIWSPHLPKIIAGAGLRYTVADDTHFYYAGLETRQIQGYFLTECEGHPLAVFPISQDLRYSIPFDLPEVTMDHLRRLRDEPGFDAVTYADDGEKFGGWPDTYQWVYEEKYLFNFFKALEEQADWLEPVTFSDYLDRHPPAGRVYLPMASYEEMMEWSLPYEAGLRFHDLKNEIENSQFNRENLKIFLRGGQWNNFLTKYEESNHLHKRMIQVGRKVKRLSPDLQESSGALRELYRSQCNCAYWHGLFGGLYLNYLRHALYSHLIAAEKIADDLLLGAERGLRAEVEDFNQDGFDEILVSNARMTAVLSPARGGTLMELDYRPACFNLSNVFKRRPEIYHRDILDAEAGNKDEGGQPQSIHHRVRFKEPGLNEKLIYDRWDRYSFMDHCLPPETTFDRFKTNRYQPKVSLAGEPYAWQVRTAGELEESAEVALSRETFKEGPEAAGLKMDKIYRFDAGEAVLAVTYRIQNAGPRPEHFLWACEFNFSLLAGDAEDRYYHVDGAGLNDARMASEGTLSAVRNLAIRDDFFKFEVEWTFDAPAEVWRFPVATVSQSEDGFESMYQGSCVTACWDMELEPGQRRDLQVQLEIRPAGNR